MIELKLSGVASRYANAEGSQIRELLKQAKQPGVISLAGGHPDPKLMPVEPLRRCLADITSHLTGDSLQYGPTEGLLELRQGVAALLQARGLTCDANEVQITTGSQQAIDLLARVLVEPDGLVAVEQFNYPAALQSFRFAGAQLINVPADEHGLDVDRLAEILKTSKPTVLYIVPNFANPTGAVLPLDRRKRLLALAEKHNITLIEDDPYGELWFTKAPPPSLALLNQQAGSLVRVAYVTSFSKVIAPALRLGVLHAPAAITRAFVLAKQAADVHSGSLEQLTLASMLSAGHLQTNLAHLRPAYAHKASALADALRLYCSDFLEFNDALGGMFIWSRIKSPVPLLSTQAWTNFGLKNRVLVVPGSEFTRDKQPQPWMRLSFSNPSVLDLEAGALRLGAGLRELVNSPESATLK